MRPPIPPPSFFRAVPGFVIGFIVAIILAGLVRMLVFGMYPLMNPTELIELYAGGFLDDEAMLMWGLFGGALGFVWGVGGVIGTPLDSSQGKALIPVERKVATSRIPSDPDAAASASENNPAYQLFGVLPQTIIVPLILILVTLLLVLIATAPVPGKVQQVTGGQGDVADIDDPANFDLLGLIDFNEQELSKGVLFGIFAAIVLATVLGLPALLAIGLYLLNRQVKEAEAAPPNPDEGQKFFPIRIAGFFNQWVLDVINQSGSIFRPR